MQGDLTLFFILLFVSVVLISQALILPAAGNKARHKELTKRLRQSHQQIDEESKLLLRKHYEESLSPTDKALVRWSAMADLKKSLELAGLNWSLSGAIGFTLVVSAIVSALLFLFSELWWIALLGFFLTAIACYFQLHRRISKRLFAFEALLPDALDVMRRVLQAGQPLNEAFREVGEEIPAPLGPEFTHTFNLLNYGYDMRLAVLQMVDRTPTVSMLALASAVLLQKETGGNLTENLYKVNQVLRARFKLSRKIKTLSAESRLSAWILVLAPFVLFIVMYLLHPEYIAPLYEHPAGIKIVSAGVVSLFFGAIWIRKIINIEV
ncbi:hypothetical protein VST7929_01815 [Vibrio stylophorae]|uniref:Type II secretion system protein GspF domain-containing protein n=1 Tax=Vibrio stylophorae TaxID=659351 RepID=A0ABM8ZUD8_9VIBR|nr:type II secretion system F family protein [Vibrio stylophorae]CAH0533938.1 hypothetical protein VST7929_01815 [Vibrio stylophorae]